jgi:ArsR family transcriptional regulator, nickel/cobalt-responsive transcriptional repressor
MPPITGKVEIPLSERRVQRIMTETKAAKECADLLQAIAEPNRIRIIDCLRTGSKNVTQLAELLKVEIVNVSHHLGVLRTAGLVEDEKHGRFVIYSLHPKFFTNDSSNATLVNLGWCKIEIPQH